MSRLGVVQHFLLETPESLYLGDQDRMKYEARKRSLDPETAAMIDETDEVETRRVFGLTGKEAA